MHWRCATGVEEILIAITAKLQHNTAAKHNINVFSSKAHLLRAFWFSVKSVAQLQAIKASEPLEKARLHKAMFPEWSSCVTDEY